MYNSLKLTFKCESVNFINTKYILYLTDNHIIIAKVLLILSRINLKTTRNIK